MTKFFIFIAPDRSLFCELTAKARCRVGQLPSQLQL